MKQVTIQVVNKIKKETTKNGISQKELALICGCKEGKINKMFKYKLSPSFEDLYSISKYLNILFKDLFSDIY